MCVLVLIALTGSAPAQTPSALSTADDWTHVADLYLTGQVRAAVAPLAQTPPEQALLAARAAFDAWETRTDEPSLRRATARRLQASAMLVLEVLLPLAGEGVATGLLPYETLGNDAVKRLEPSSQDTWGSAPEDGRLLRQFRAWWQVAMLQYLVASRSDRRDVVIRAARPAFPATEAAATADRAFLIGLVAETEARASAPGDWPAPGGPGSQAGDTTPHSRTRYQQGWREVDQPTSRKAKLTLGLEAAARSFREALELDPTHVEAHLHLGRVLLELERLDESATHLRPLATAPCNDAICGLAWLSLGEIHEQRDQPEDAAMAYVRASGTTMTRQAAVVALMQLALRRGDTAQAFGLTAQFERGPLAASSGADAWTNYTSGRRQRPDAVHQRLKAALLP